MGQRPTALVAFGKRRKIGKQSSGLFPVRNPRRGFLGRAHGPQRTSASQPALPAKACAALWRKRAERASTVPPRPLPGLSPVGRVRPVRCTFPPAAPVKAVERCSTPRKLLKKFDQNFYAASRFGSAFILPADCAGPAPAWPCPGSAPGSWGTPGSPWSPAPARSSTGRGSYAAGTAVLQNFPIGSRR